VVGADRLIPDSARGVVLKLEQHSRRLLLKTRKRLCRLREELHSSTITCTSEVARFEKTIWTS